MHILLVLVFRLVGLPTVQPFFPSFISFPSFSFSIKLFSSLILAKGNGNWHWTGQQNPTSNVGALIRKNCFFLELLGPSDCECLPHWSSLSLSTSYNSKFLLTFYSASFLYLQQEYPHVYLYPISPWGGTSRK